MGKLDFQIRQPCRICGVSKIIERRTRSHPCRSRHLQHRRLAPSGLTTRSSGAPTAGHQARSGGTRYIFASPGLASCRRRPLSSNVRHQKPSLWCFQQKTRRVAPRMQQPPRGKAAIESSAESQLPLRHRQNRGKRCAPLAKKRAKLALLQGSASRGKQLWPSKQGLSVSSSGQPPCAAEWLRSTWSAAAGKTRRRPAWSARSGLLLCSGSSGSVVAVAHCTFSHCWPH